MFLEKNIVDFINKIINNSNEEEKDLRLNIEKFRDYLKLTKMGNENSIAWINKVISCLPEIISLKKKIKNIDITTIISIKEDEIPKKVSENKKQVKEKKYENKHYHHYDCGSSSSCGSSGSGSTFYTSYTRSGC